MDNQNKICPQCGAVNQPHFTYCRMCGTALGFNDGYSQAAPRGHYYEPNVLGGHPIPKVRAFVGTNHSGNKIIQKFTDMELNHSSSSWCWPVFLLSILLGPAFSSLWFIYRKMYKTGFWVALGGLLIAAAQMLISFNYTVYVIREIFNIIRSGGSDVSMFSTELPMESILTDMLTSIISLLTFAGAAVLSIFSLGIYKNFMSKQINKYPAADLFVLSRIGGTNEGSVVLGTILILISHTIISMIPVIYAISLSIPSITL